jgi:hypothetical protein
MHEADGFDEIGQGEVPKERFRPIFAAARPRVEPEARAVNSGAVAARSHDRAAFLLGSSAPRAQAPSPLATIAIIARNAAKAPNSAASPINPKAR